MTTESARDSIAARWVIELDDPAFSEEQRKELTRWLMSSANNCDTFIDTVRAWRWSLLLYRDQAPLLRDKQPQDAGASSSAGGRSARQGIIDRRFGALLLAAREERGFTRAELASSIGMREADIEEIEDGARTLTLPVMFVLARALGIAPSRLATRLEKLMSGEATSSRKRKSD